MRGVYNVEICRNWCLIGLESQGHEKTLNFLPLAPGLVIMIGNTRGGEGGGYFCLFIYFLM